MYAYRCQSISYAHTQLALIIYQQQRNEYRKNNMLSLSVLSADLLLPAR